MTELTTPYLAWIQDSENSNAVGTIVEAQVKDIIAAGSFGLHAAATAAQNPTGAVGQNNLYRLPNAIQVTDYKRDGSNVQKGKMDLVQVPVDKERSVLYELETFDIADMQNIPAGTVLATLASSVGLSILAYLDAVFISNVLKQAIYNTAPEANDPLIKEAIAPIELDFGGENATRETTWSGIRKLSKTAARLSKTLDTKIFGVDQNQVMTVLDPEAMVDVLFGLQGYSGNNEMKKNTSSETLTINGVNYSSHILIGQIIAKEQAFNKDEAFDLRTAGSDTLLGLMFHNQSYAMPFTERLFTTMVVNPDNANPRYITKFKYGFGALRPQLTRMLVEKGEGSEGTKFKALREAVETEIAEREAELENPIKVNKKAAKMAAAK